MEKYKKANELKKTFQIGKKLANIPRILSVEGDFASRKPDFANQSAAKSQKIKRLKNEKTSGVSESYKT